MLLIVVVDAIRGDNAAREVIDGHRFGCHANGEMRNGAVASVVSVVDAGWLDLWMHEVIVV